MMRLTLYGFPETPFSNHFKPCNPKSIKPIDYRQSNIINYKLYFAIEKGIGASGLVIALYPDWINRMFEHEKL